MFEGPSGALLHLFTQHPPLMTVTPPPTPLLCLSLSCARIVPVAQSAALGGDVQLCAAFLGAFSGGASVGRGRARSGRASRRGGLAI